MSSPGANSGADQLYARLNDPRVAEGLNRLLDRIDTISFAVDSVEGLLSRGETIADSVQQGFGDLRNLDTGNGNLLAKAPRMLATGSRLADAADELDVEAIAASHVLGRMTEPETLATINRLLDRLPIAEFLLSSLEGFIERGETIADSVADSVNEAKHLVDGPAAELMGRAPQLMETGVRLADLAADVDLDALLQSGILERLSRPETIGTLGEMLDRLPLAAFLLEATEGFIRRGETIADSVADSVHDLNLGAIEIDPEHFSSLLETLPKLKKAGEKLLDSNLLDEGLPQVIDAGVQMVESGMLDPEVVAVLGDLGKKAANTYREVAAEPIEPVGGLWSTYRAMRDKDVQQSVGFFIAFARAFAKHLRP